MDISVVIPAYNEEEYISNTVMSITKWMPAEFEYEIIVVDHGSLDKTAALARSAGAIVVDGSASKTIAALRNLGVSCSSSKVLFFVDADVTFTNEWSTNITKVILDLKSNPNTIRGSLPRIPLDSPLMLKYWFDPKSMESSPKHIGSCHLLTSRALFEEINGFPEEMETSEEFNFCLNAISKGAKIYASPNLIVIHHGSPKTLVDFVKREVWHGRGDWVSFSSVLSSKVALVTLIFLCLHLLLFSSLVLEGSQPLVAICLVCSIIILCLASSMIKFLKHGFHYALINSVTFYLYLFARSLSFFSAIVFRKIKKHSRDI